MKKIDLTQIGFFNPGRLTDKEIELSFVARFDFFQYIFDKIIDESPNSIPQQYLIIGQRGMGKTSLLLRMAVELRKKPHANHFIALTFPEEQYNIDRLSKFWYNCLNALSDVLDKEKQTLLAKTLDQEIDNITKQHYQESNAMYAIFEKWTQKIERRPVLLVDNLNLIFDEISKEEQHQLRAILMSANAPIMIGASVSTINETIDYGSPFFDAFQIQNLKKLSFEESQEVLQNIANITGKDNFEYLVRQNRDRLWALYQLSGGTPRTVSMLFPLIQEGFSEDIQTELDALLDIFTPLYKARFEALPSQLRVILNAIALHWNPVTIEQIRNITQLDNAQLSPQLKRLVDLGWLQKLAPFETKGSTYELSERFFNIWCLMRSSNRRQKRELYCLTKFLQSMYGQELESIAHTRIHSMNNSSNQLFFDLALADGLKNKNLEKKLKNKSYVELLALSKNDENILSNFNIPDKQIKKEVYKLRIKCIDYWNKKEFKKGFELTKQALRLTPNSANSNYNYGVFCQFLSNYNEAKESFLRAIELDGTDADIWNGLGNLYQDYFEEYKLAANAYQKAIELNNSPFPKYNLVFLYRDKLNQLDKAKEVFATITETEELKDSHYLNHALFAYYDNNAGVAQKSIEKALAIIKNNIPSNTQDDWWRAAAVAIKLGYGIHFLKILKDTGYDIIFNPFYIAIQALIDKKPSLFFNTIAVEIREPAQKIMTMMIKYNAG